MKKGILEMEAAARKLYTVNQPIVANRPPRADDFDMCIPNTIWLLKHDTSRFGYKEVFVKTCKEDLTFEWSRYTKVEDKA